MRLIAAAVLLSVVSLAGCETVENAADHTRDFVQAHPVAVSVVASVAVTSLVTTYELHKADQQMKAQLGAALAPLERPPTAVLHP